MVYFYPRYQELRAKISGLEVSRKEAPVEISLGIGALIQFF